MIADSARLAAGVVDEAGLCFFPLKARKGVALEPDKKLSGMRSVGCDPVDGMCGAVSVPDVLSTFHPTFQGRESQGGG